MYKRDRPVRIRFLKLKRRRYGCEPKAQLQSKVQRWIIDIGVDKYEPHIMACRILRYVQRVKDIRLEIDDPSAWESQKCGAGRNFQT